MTGRAFDRLPFLAISYIFLLKCLYHFISIFINIFRYVLWPFEKLLLKRSFLSSYPSTSVKLIRGFIC